MDIKRIKHEILEQKKTKFMGNIYHYSQVNFACNSNKIEGTQLSSDETEEIFETSSFIPKDNDSIKLDDLTKNHKKSPIFYKWWEDVTRNEELF